MIGSRLAPAAAIPEDAADHLIAQKRVEHGADPEQPSFEMNDVPTGLRESARVGVGAVEPFSGELAEGSRGEWVARPESAVIDAGFDAHLRGNFAVISSGQRIESRGLPNAADERGDRCKARIAFDTPDDGPRPTIASVATVGSGAEGQ